MVVVTHWMTSVPAEGDQKQSPPLTRSSLTAPYRFRVMRRCFALLQAIWLALLIAEPFPLHACAMHSGGHGVHAAPPVVDADAAHHHDDPTGLRADDAGTPPIDAESPAVCQCLGQCCAGAVTPLAAASVHAVETPSAVVPVVLSAVSERATRAPDLQLPFPTAPPAALTV